MTSQHLHLILNHMPIFGFMAALIPLTVGVLRKSRELVLVGLLMGALFGATTPVVFFAGESAEEILEARLDPSAREWLDTHEERAETAAPVVYVVTLACIVGVVALYKRPRWLRPLGVTGALTLCSSIALLAWVGQAGGRIRHPELRPVSATAEPPQRSGPRNTEEHDDD